MGKRDRLVLTLLAVVASAWLMLLAVAGASDALLYVGPLLALLIPLICGRYPGEEGLARLAAGSRSTRAKTAPNQPRPRCAPRRVPRGGRLIATALAVRPPPATAPPV